MSNTSATAARSDLISRAVLWVSRRRRRLAFYAIVFLLFGGTLTAATWNHKENLYCTTYAFGFPFPHHIDHCLCDAKGGLSRDYPFAAVLNPVVYGSLGVCAMRLFVAIFSAARSKTK